MEGSRLMAPRSQRVSMFVACLLLAAFTAGCPPISEIRAVTLDAPATVTSGATVQLQATVQGRGRYDPAVVWTVEGGGSIADAATGTSAVYTAPFVSVETSVEIRVASAVDPSKSARHTMTVTPAEAFDVEVDPDLEPGVSSVLGANGDEVETAASRDAVGVQSDFVVGQVLLRPASQDELDAFIARYGATILRDNTVPEPPARLGIVLTPEERRATEYVLQVDLAAVSLADFVANAERIGLSSLLSVSSHDGLLTLAAATEALAAGYAASPNYLSYPTQTFPSPLFRTHERTEGGVVTSALDAALFPRFQSNAGSHANVTLAWQFLMAHGVTRRVEIAIIDEGFWLDASGLPRGDDSDFPPEPVQYDFRDDDYIADGPAVIGCGAGNPCFWHGTGAAGVATGRADDFVGAAGTGALVAEPLLFRRGGLRDQDHRAVRTAVAWGADVVSMSFGGDCNQACRTFDERHNPFREAIEAGSRVVFLAAAGNGAAGIGYDVGDPSFFRPCIDTNVICVGALDDDATTKIGYSNFGAEVDIFAPTNNRVMSYPDSLDGAGMPLANAFGPEVPQTFGGTSSATPFVAGVVAMMKAIDPSLSNEDVRRILHDTAHHGTEPVARYLDAYAAVRMAAENVPAVRDRFEVGPNGNGFTTPTLLAGPGPWAEGGLNLHDASDRDYFQFELAEAAALTIDVAYPEGLGEIPRLGLDALGTCGDPVLVSDQALRAGHFQGRRIRYEAPLGPLRFGLGGGLLNAYILTITPSAADGPAALPDGYEPNDVAAAARRLFSYLPGGSGLEWSLVLDPKFDIAATLHTSSDEDFYIVRGKAPTIAELVFLTGRPAVRVYDNDARVELEVFELALDGAGKPMAGAFVGRASSSGCHDTGVEVLLSTGEEYLVRVSGARGRYRLQNGIRAEARHLPMLMRDRVYEVLNPGEPITRILEGRPFWYVFVGDPAFGAIDAAGNVQLELYDAQSALVAQSASGRLDLAGVRRDQVFALSVTPAAAVPGGTSVDIAWDALEPVRSTGNLLANPGAEEGPGSASGGAVDGIPGWYQHSDFIEYPTVLIYGTGDGYPTPDDPGPAQRGAQFFAGGPGTAHSGVRQDVAIAPGWQAAVAAGTVKFELSAFLGGYGAQADGASVTLTFLDTAYRELAHLVLGPVTALEREGATGMWPRMASGYIPSATSLVWVDLDFVRAEGFSNDGYADALELVFHEHAR